MHRCGTPAWNDTALPSPTTEFPPTDITHSTDVALRDWTACSVIEIGMCVVASENAPPGSIKASLF
jgi:hypothetical protein